MDDIKVRRVPIQEQPTPEPEPAVPTAPDVNKVVGLAVPPSDVYEFRPGGGSVLTIDPAIFELRDTATGSYMLITRVEPRSTQANNLDGIGAIISVRNNGGRTIQIRIEATEI